MRLRTLGRFELVDGEPPSTRLIPAQSKRLALLAYLALAAPRGPHRRDILLALFWPELDQEEARRALRQALHALRRWLGEAVLVSLGDDRVELAPGGCWCDAVAFESALEHGDLEAALTLYQGGFLEGVFVTDVSPEFEQWVDLTRTRLRGRALDAAMALGHKAGEGGDVAAALRWASAAHGLAPDNEAAVRLLMRALGDSGDRSQALQLFQSFAARLTEEFGADPAGETRALAATLRVAPASPPSAAPEGASAPERPMAGSPDPAPARQRETGRPRGRSVAVAIVAVLSAAGLLFAGGYLRGRSPPSAPQRLLVADFQNHTRDSLLAGVVTDAITIDLSQSRRARVLTRAQLQAVLKRMELPTDAPLSADVVREVAERDGVTAFVTGDVASLGTGFTISAALVSAKTGDVLAAVRAAATDSTGLLTAVDQVSTQLRRRIGESAQTIDSSLSLERVTTNSLDGLRLYSQAVRVGDQGGDQRRAVELLRLAIKFDTTFAMAFRKLGTYLSELREADGAYEALARAFQYRDRLPLRERYHTMGSYYYNPFTNLPDSAIAAYRALLAIYPDDTRALNNIGVAYTNLRQYRRAVGFHRLALESDSTISLIYNALATAQLNAGMFADASFTLKAKRRKFPAQQDAEVIELSIAAERGDFAEAYTQAKALLEAAGADLDSRLQPLRILGTLAFIQGRLQEAQGYLRAVTEICLREKEPGNYRDGAIMLGFIDIWYRHAPERGVRVIDSALSSYGSEKIPMLDQNLGWLSYAYALAGQPARTRELLRSLQAFDSATAGPGGRRTRKDGGYLRSRGAAEFAEGRYADAVKTLRESVDVYFCPTCSLPDLARAYDLAGQADSAIAVYERYLSTPWSEWWESDGEFTVTTYRRLGQLYEQRGDRPRAIAAYRKVAELWSHADAELQPEVDSARRRVVALEAGGR